MVGQLFYATDRCRRKDQVWVHFCNQSVIQGLDKSLTLVSSCGYNWVREHLNIYLRVTSICSCSVVDGCLCVLIRRFWKPGLRWNESAWFMLHNITLLNEKEHLPLIYPVRNSIHILYIDQDKRLITLII